jgi:uncharacterized protein YaaQ
MKYGLTMKLIVAIAPNREQTRVVDALNTAGIAFTKLGSTGGFMRQGSTTLLIGVEEEECPRVLAILKEHFQRCERIVSVAPDPNPALAAGSFTAQPVVAESGGGVAFVVDVDKFVRF